MYFSCCGTLVVYFEWEQGSADIHRNSDSYQHSSKSTKTCQVADYLMPLSSITLLGNLGCIPNRYQHYCKTVEKFVLQSVLGPCYLKGEQ